MEQVWTYEYHKLAEACGGALELQCMPQLGKILIFFGSALVVVGALLVIGGRLNLPVGRLPGDIVYRGKHSVMYFPIVTCIVLSIVLSLILYLAGRFSR